MAEGDLRETFNLPLVSGRQAEHDAAQPGPDIGDAAALFDDRPAKRKPTAAELRAKARRCSSCGGIVPVGMSTCISCGLDQETGIRVGFDDEDLLPSGPARSQGPPIHVAIIGGLCAVVALLVLLLAVTRSVRGDSDWRQYAWLVIALVCGYGIYTAVEFIRGRTAKLLMVALALGIVIDLMAMVAMPIIEGIVVDPTQIVSTNTKPDLDDAAEQIKPPEERFDTQRIIYGVGVVVIFAGLCAYLMSSPVKKYIHSRAPRPYE